MRLDKRLDSDTGDRIDPARLAAALNRQPLPVAESAALRAAVLDALFHPERATLADATTVDREQSRHGNVTFGLWLAGDGGAPAAPAAPPAGEELAVVVGYGMAAIAATKTLVKIDTTTRCLSRWSVRRRLRHLLTASARADVTAYLLGLCRSASARLTSPDPDKFDIAVSECTTLLEVLIAAEPFTKVAPDGADRIGIDARTALSAMQGSERAALRAVSAQARTPTP